MPTKKYSREIIEINGVEFVIEVEKRPGKELDLHLEKLKTRLCPACAETIRDDDGEVIAHHVKRLEAFLEVKPVGRKPGLCPICKREHDKISDKERKRYKRARARKKKPKKTEPIRWPECPQYDECIKTGKLNEAAKANKDFSCKSCPTYLENLSGKTQCN